MSDILFYALSIALAGFWEKSYVFIFDEGNPRDGLYNVQVNRFAFPWQNFIDRLTKQQESCRNCFYQGVSEIHCWAANVIVLRIWQDGNYIRT